MNICTSVVLATIYNVANLAHCEHGFKNGCACEFFFFCFLVVCSFLFFLLMLGCCFEGDGMNHSN